MLISIALILLLGLAAGELSRRLKLPGLIGMILAGILIGPYVLNLLDPGILELSADLRKIALIIILIRAGLKLDFQDLKKAGRPALLLCFVPACFEIIGSLVLAPVLFGFSLLDAAILGSVIAAVSPAVIVPRMIRLIDEKRGTKHGIPQMILAGASVDDVFVIVLFTAFTSSAQGSGISWISFAEVPVSIVIGILGGLIAGLAAVQVFRKIQLSLPAKAAVVFGVSLVLNWLEGTQNLIPFAGLIAVMAFGMMIYMKNAGLASELSGVFDRLWVPAEIFLFVLVGSSCNLQSLQSEILPGILFVLGALIFRMVGVLVCVLHTDLTRNERLFCMIAYTPKATVQAAIGGMPLAMGLSCGQTVLTVSVISILLTAPLGAFAIDSLYKKLLSDDSPLLSSAQAE